MPISDVKGLRYRVVSMLEKCKARRQKIITDRRIRQIVESVNRRCWAPRTKMRRLGSSCND